ncbi:hypothetical protein RvY_02620 [Ramazzottius varieornatus]|uniref:V-SNARE coiled-coil homology domain-containing protein n=1 Tax=Ramazzottius varieornatus TaxID=947166 RepID=A0A1D1UR60_RAMVA|nr:hypothetical protein RvY_02620 [Ramazzottius varieornatus]
MYNANSAGGGTSGAGGSGRQGGNKIEQTQKQVNEVIDVMKDNVNRVLERGDRLADLDERADALQFGAHQFQATAKKVKRKYWWKNLKMWILIGVILAVIITVIVVATLPPGSGGSSTSGSPTPGKVNQPAPAADQPKALPQNGLPQSPVALPGQANG